MTTVTRWTITLLGGLAAALLLGLAAAHFGPDDDLIELTVYTACLWPPCIGGLYVFTAPREVLPEHPEDNVESAWLQQATSGAFIDLVTVLGLATAADVVFGVGPVPLVVVFLLALGDAALRYGVIRQREA